MAAPKLTQGNIDQIAIQRIESIVNGAFDYDLSNNMRLMSIIGEICGVIDFRNEMKEYFETGV